MPPPSSLEKFFFKGFLFDWNQSWNEGREKHSEFIFLETDLQTGSGRVRNTACKPGCGSGLFLTDSSLFCPILTLLQLETESGFYPKKVL